MSNEPFRWGVVGPGKHFRNFMGPAIAASNNGVLVAVSSRDPETAAKTVAPYGDVRVHDSYEALVNDTAVDGIFLASPNHLHRDQVLVAANGGRHILCEKPLGITVGECVEMIEACRVANVKLGVGFNQRHNELHRKAKHVLDEGRLGTLEYVEVRYFHAEGATHQRAPQASWRTDPKTMGGGPFTSTGGHSVDLVRYVTGLEVNNVAALQDATTSFQQERLLQASFSLSDGTIATVLGGKQAFPFNELLVCGSEGTVRCSNSVGNYGTGRLEIVTESGTETIDAPKHDPYTGELERFVDAVRADVEPDANGVDGLRALEITEAVYAAIRTNTKTRQTVQRHQI